MMVHYRVHKSFLPIPILSQEGSPNMGETQTSEVDVTLQSFNLESRSDVQ
jgi:hypothetical protein